MKIEKQIKPRRFSAPNRVIQKDVNGNVVEIYSSLNEAAHAQGFCSPSGLRNYILSGKEKNGFTYEYEAKNKYIPLAEKKMIFDHMKHVPYGI